MSVMFNSLRSLLRPSNLVTNYSNLHTLVSQESTKLLNIKSCLPATSLIDFNQKRNNVIRKPIISYPRRLPYFVVRPEPYKYNFQPIYPKDGEYTYKHIRVRKLAGRHPDTGRVVISTRGGGIRKWYYWMDMKYPGEWGETTIEKVFKVRYHPWYSNLVALVARGGFRRWIVASENMKPGDVIKTIKVIPKNPVYAKEGQMMPLGALSPGTRVHMVELHPGEGGSLARNAGTSCEILRRIEKNIVVKAPSGQEYALDEKCMASVGRVSNPLHYTVDELNAVRMWWKGRRPAKGQWHRKDGYCGRKLKPPKQLKWIDAEKQLPQKLEHFNINLR